MRQSELYQGIEESCAYAFIVEYYFRDTNGLMNVAIKNAGAEIRLNTGKSFRVLVSMTARDLGAITRAVKNADISIAGKNYKGRDLGPSLIGGIMMVKPDCKSTIYLDLGAEYPNLL